MAVSQAIYYQVKPYEFNSQVYHQGQKNELCLRN